MQKYIQNIILIGNGTVLNKIYKKLMKMVNNLYKKFNQNRND